MGAWDELVCRFWTGVSCADVPALEASQAREEDQGLADEVLAADEDASIDGDSLDLSRPHREVVRRALGAVDRDSDSIETRMDNIRDGFISRDESDDMIDAGLSQAFVERLRGPNGTETITRRARWLSDHADLAWDRWDSSAETRRDFLLELGGLAARRTPGLRYFRLLEREDSQITSAAREASHDNLLSIIHNSSENAQVRAAAIYTFISLTSDPADAREIITFLDNLERSDQEEFDQLAEGAEQVAEELPANRRRFFLNRIGIYGRAARRIDAMFRGNGSGNS